MRIDGHIYVEQVVQFDSGSIALEPFDVALRAFKPFPGVWGALLVPLYTPMEALQLLNIFLLIGLPFAAYLFLREFGFEDREATWGALWIVMGYPVLKYGLAIGTDIGGWFFATLTAGLFLRGMNKNSIPLLITASLCGFVGGTLKEPGVVGLIFGGLLLLSMYRILGIASVSKRMFWFAIPALLLEGVLFFFLTRAGFPSFVDWFLYVRTAENLEEQYQFIKFLGVEASAFHILIPLACVGAFAIFVARVGMIPYVRMKIVTLIIATLPVLLWTFFISRILYIQFLFMVPLALIGLSYVLERIRLVPQSVLCCVLFSIPIVLSILLYMLAGTKSLFTIFVG